MKKKILRYIKKEMNSASIDMGNTGSDEYQQKWNERDDEVWAFGYFRALEDLKWEIEEWDSTKKKPRDFTELCGAQIKMTEKDHKKIIKQILSLTKDFSDHFAKPENSMKKKTIIKGILNETKDFGKE